MNWRIQVDYSDGQAVIITEATDLEAQRAQRLITETSDTTPKFVALIIREDLVQIINLDRVDAITITLNDEEDGDE